MVRIAPVQALVYDAGLAGPAEETSAPPWSDVDRFDRAARRTANPYTVVELHTIDPSASPDERFSTARSALARWLRTGVLAPLPKPVMGLYRMTEPSSDAVHEGLLCTVGLDGDVLLHEDVDAERARSRSLRLQHVPLDTTPVVALHFGMASGAQRLLGDLSRRMPALVDLVDEDGVRHQIWTMDEPEDLAVLVKAMEGVQAVLADGHHRVAAAAVAAERTGTPPETLALLMDAEHRGPELHAVHRLVRVSHPDPAGRLAEVAGVTCRPFERPPHALRDSLRGTLPDALAHGSEPHARAFGRGAGHRRRFGLITTGGSWMVEVEPGLGQQLLAEAGVHPVLRELDVVVLHEVLFPIIGAYHEDSLPDALVTVDADTDALRGDADLVVLMQPPGADEVMAVARAGQLMPPKTTWFRPKPRAGLIMRQLATTPDR